jgi:hypothetical protein
MGNTQIKQPRKHWTIFLSFTLGMIGLDKFYAGEGGEWTYPSYLLYVQIIFFIFSKIGGKFGRVFSILNNMIRYLSIMSLVCTIIYPNEGGEELVKLLYPDVKWEPSNEWDVAAAWIFGSATLLFILKDVLLSGECG